jgi:hypothetical protein
LEVYIPAKDIYCLEESVSGSKSYEKWLDIPTNLEYYVYDYERFEVEDGHIFDDQNSYYVINPDHISYRECTEEEIKAHKEPWSYEYSEVQPYAAFYPYRDYYTKSVEKDEEGKEVVTYVKENIKAFDAETIYYVRIGETYYYHAKPTEENGLKEEFIPVKYSNLVDLKSGTEIKYYIKSISAALPLYVGRFVYEQSGKLIDGFIKYEESEWSRLKGYTDTEYISPTLVQNFLANSMEIVNLNSGWLFDGSPNDKNRAGELTNLLDDPTRPDPDEDVEGSMLILHLTDKPVHYASQTGDYLYTNYDFVVENPMISQEEFWEGGRYYNKEEYSEGNKYPLANFTKILPQDVSKYESSYVFKVSNNRSGEAPYLEQVNPKIVSDDYLKDSKCIRAELSSEGTKWA